MLGDRRCCTPPIWAGGARDEAHGIAVDGSGNAYVAGFTTSADFPTANPLQASNAGRDDAFVLLITGP
jgi:hypothetical protein